MQPLNPIFLPLTLKQGSRDRTDGCDGRQLRRLWRCRCRGSATGVGLATAASDVSQPYGSLESGIRDAFRKLGVSKATVWRWVRRIADEGGRTSEMVARKHCRPSGTVMVPIEVDAVIGGYLARDYLRRERPSLARVVTEIRIA